ncbi:hypothetical protein HYDPIDRAFT_26104 [Hydnomerulius pinastri MD-312]|nr:hypothetical protein HYDPIDRAFT_26104 [Hydnomerulius pinastri MD-312]
MAHNTAQYVALRQHDVDEGKESSSPVATDPVHTGPQPFSRSLPRWEWVSRGILLLLSVVFFMLWMSNRSTCSYVLKYSPANEAIEYVEHVKYKGSLHFVTPYRGDESGDPSPEIDGAWRRVTTDGRVVLNFDFVAFLVTYASDYTVKPTRLTEEQLKKMGITTSSSTVKFPEEDGGGYLASLEVTHHLQCLYESFDPAFQGDEVAVTNQLQTCVEVIRQALMCYPDLNMVPYYWVHGYKSPFGDANTIHRCKNFGKVLDWAADNAADVSHVKEF